MAAGAALVAGPCRATATCGVAKLLCPASAAAAAAVWAQLHPSAHCSPSSSALSPATHDRSCSSMMCRPLRSWAERCRDAAPAAGRPGGCGCGGAFCQRCGSEDVFYPRCAELYRCGATRVTPRTIWLEAALGIRLYLELEPIPSFGMKPCKNRIKPYEHHIPELLSPLPKRCLDTRFFVHPAVSGA